jgi:hypothetical protein
MASEPLRSDVDVGPSFTRYMLENDRLHGLTEIEMAFLAGTFWGAGSETVTCLLSSQKSCG